MLLLLKVPVRWVCALHMAEGATDAVADRLLLICVRTVCDYRIPVFPFAQTDRLPVYKVESFPPELDLMVSWGT